MPVLPATCTSQALPVQTIIAKQRAAILTSPMTDSAIAQPSATHVHEPLSGSADIEMERLDHPAPRPTKSNDKMPSWWKRHIAPDVPFETCRDHYGSSWAPPFKLHGEKLTLENEALERTFLAWIRTSVKFAHFGVVVTQLFRLPKAIFPSSPAISQFYRLGKPLGLVSISFAVLFTAIAGFRCWQQQRYLIDGKIRSCGWEIWSVILLTVGVSRCHHLLDKVAMLSHY